MGKSLLGACFADKKGRALSGCSAACLLGITEVYNKSQGPPIDEPAELLDQWMNKALCKIAAAQRLSRIAEPCTVLTYCLVGGCLLLNTNHTHVPLGLIALGLLAML